MSENRQDEAPVLEAFEFPPDPADDFEWVPATAEVAGDLAEPPEADWRTAGTSRRAFLRGVVCSGVAVSDRPICSPFNRARRARRCAASNG